MKLASLLIASIIFLAPPLQMCDYCHHALAEFVHEDEEYCEGCYMHLVPPPRSIPAETTETKPVDTPQQRVWF